MFFHRLSLKQLSNAPSVLNALLFGYVVIFCYYFGCRSQLFSSVGESCEEVNAPVDNILTISWTVLLWAIHCVLVFTPFCVSDRLSFTRAKPPAAVQQTRSVS